MIAAAGASHQERGPVRIEFFGLPGSGKTTIARALHERLHASDPGIIFSPTLTRDEVPGAQRTAARLLLIGRHLPRHRPELHVLGRVAATRQRTGRDWAKAIFNLLTTLSVIEQISRSGRSAVIDQGLLQAAWSAYLRSPDEIPLDAWAPLLSRHLAQPSAFVCVRTPVDVCIARLNRRHGRHSRMQSRELLRDPAAWEHAERLRGRLMDVLIQVVRAGDAAHALILVDGMQDPRDTAAAVAQQLCHLPPKLAELPGQEDPARRAVASSGAY